MTVEENCVSPEFFGADQVISFAIEFPPQEQITFSDPLTFLIFILRASPGNGEQVYSRSNGAAGSDCTNIDELSIVGTGTEVHYELKRSTLQITRDSTGTFLSQLADEIPAEPT